MVLDALDDLSSEIRLLEAELGICQPSVAPSPVQHYHALPSRLKKLSLHLEVVREQGVRMLQKELEEAREIYRSIASAPDNIRKEMAAKLDAEVKLRQQLEAELKQHKGNPAHTSQSAQQSSSHSTMEMELLKRKVAEAEKLTTRFKKQLDDEANRRAEEAEAHFQSKHTVLYVALSFLCLLCFLVAHFLFVCALPLFRVR